MSAFHTMTVLSIDTEARYWSWGAQATSRMSPSWPLSVVTTRHHSTFSTPDPKLMPPDVGGNKMVLNRVIFELMPPDLGANEIVLIIVPGSHSVLPTYLLCTLVLLVVKADGGF